MTPEQIAFEAWYNKAIGQFMELDGMVISWIAESWQASREQLKAKLLSDEMVLIVEKMIDMVLTTDGEETTTRNLAKAALEAVVEVI